MVASEVKTLAGKTRLATDEIVRTMKLLGCGSLAELDASYLERPTPPARLTVTTARVTT